MLPLSIAVCSMAPGDEAGPRAQLYVNAALYRARSLAQARSASGWL